MKYTIGLLYLSTAMIGFYWSIYLTLTGLYGIPFSRWYIVVFIGAIFVLLGGIFCWVSSSGWTRWFPVIGNLLLSSYFVPAGIVLIRQGRLDLIRVVLIAVVLMSLIVAVKQLTYPKIEQRSNALRG
jgi:hypothetical protein